MPTPCEPRGVSITAIIIFTVVALLAVFAAAVTRRALRLAHVDHPDVQSIRPAAIPTDPLPTPLDASAWDRRNTDFTIEYLDPLTAQRVTIAQDDESFGIDAARTTARTTAMMFRGVNIEIWQSDIETRDRTLIDMVELEPRRIA